MSEKNVDEFKVFASFVGTIYKVQTLRGGDGDFRITIDVPMTMLGRDQMTAIAEIMRAEKDYRLVAFAAAKQEKQKLN